jgi:NitT/TauT family transport system permease protein
MKRFNLLLPFIPAIMITSLTEWAVRKGWVPGYLLPAPSQVLQALTEDSSSFKTAFLQTLEASSLGWLLAMTTGLGFALLLSFSRIIRGMFYPYAIFFQTVPIIAIAPLLVIWLGYGLPTVVASAFIVSIFPVIANSVLGLTETDPLLLNLFRMMDATPLQTLFKLRFPAALPQILGGFKIAAGLSVIGAIVGEFISGSGLGGLVDSARNQQRVDRVFASVLLASALGILFFAFISWINSLVLGAQKDPQS